jgi:hypothetical protein
VAESWDPAAEGVLRLPSGRLVRGRGLHRPRGGGRTAAGPQPEFGLYVLGRRPPETTWPMRWLHWPDFWLPRDRGAAIEAIRDAWDRTGSQRVEVACDGGRGRTGTALSCIAVLDGVPNGEAVAYVRAHYHPKAVETPWQRHFVAGFPPARSAAAAAPTVQWFRQ